MRSGVTAGGSMEGVKDGGKMKGSFESKWFNTYVAIPSWAVNDGGTDGKYLHLHFICAHPGWSLDNFAVCTYVRIHSWFPCVKLLRWAFAGMQKVNIFSICSPSDYMAECKLVFYHTSSVLSVSHRRYQKWEWGVSSITRCQLQTSSVASRHVLDARKCEILFWTWPETLSWDWIQQVLAKWLNQSLAGLDRRRSQIMHIIVIPQTMCYSTMTYIILTVRLVWNASVQD